jgi:TfoX/Sxy family transcriptional regulator of competence genes
MPFDPGLADRIHQILGRMCPFEEKRMFGGIAYMVNGHMCCGVVKADLMLRLGPAGVQAALKEPHTREMDFTGKPMRSMIYVGAAGIDSDDALESWLRRAAEFARQS